MINLNAASLKQLAEIPGLPIAQAYDLHLWAPYAAWEEVVRTPGVTAATVWLLQKSGVVLGAAAPAHSTAALRRCPAI